MKQKIYYHHTDCGGVVYYGTYLKFLEEARTELMAEKGVLVKELAAQGMLFVVSRQEIDYKLPVGYGEIISIETRISQISRVKIAFEYEIKNQKGRMVALARTILACVGTDFKPQAIPEEIREKLAEKPLG